MPTNPSLDKHPGVDEWLSVGSDGRVRVRSGKVDIGQRISTAIALIVAEELDVELDRVEVQQRETGISPDEGYSSGSNSMEESGHAVRLAAATARHHLVGLATAALDVDAGSIEIADGALRSRETNQATTYWELIGDKEFGIAIDHHASLKAPGDYRRVGRPVEALGMRDLVAGTARFVHDMRMPGMLHARVVRPPHYHARLSDLDATLPARLAETGVRLVRDGNFLAVAGADEFAVTTAVDRVAAAATWTPEQGLDARDVYERLMTEPRVSLPVFDGLPQEAPVPDLGDPPTGATQTLQARYERPYQMHGSIGPSAALARFEDGRLTVWTHSQGIYPLQASLAEALHMAVDDVHLIHVPGAGCYGHNGADDAALDAALIARSIPEKPVLLKWSRADEHAWEPYGSCMAVDLCASLDVAGSVIAWSHDTYSDTHMARPRPGPDRIGPARLLATGLLAEPLEAPAAQPNMARHGGIHRNADPLYAFPERRIVKHLVPGLPLRTSTMRTLGGYANVFAIESFVDELAAAAGIDSVAFRLNHLHDERAQAVLEAAATAIGWRQAARPPGLGQGIGFAQYKNVKAYAAVAVELEVTDAADIRLHRAVIAADAGQVVDPDGLAAQLEGGFLQGASWTLYEQVRFDAGGITSRDWDSYPILRFDNVPRGPAGRSSPRCRRGHPRPHGRRYRQRHLRRHRTSIAAPALHARRGARGRTGVT
jgi:CO/xanthine dehydrogenase Mo-binding subunit